MKQSQTIVIQSHGAGQTRKIGQAIGEALGAGDVVLLEGELGTGKTVLTQGICAGLGLGEDIPARSPTFSLIHEYRGAALPIRHADLYRIGGEEDLETIGLFDANINGVTIIEWSERLPEGGDFTGAVTVRITDVSENERRLEVTAPLDILEKSGLLACAAEKGAK